MFSHLTKHQRIKNLVKAILQIINNLNKSWTQWSKANHSLQCRRKTDKSNDKNKILKRKQKLTDSHPQITVQILGIGRERQGRGAHYQWVIVQVRSVGRRWRQRSLRRHWLWRICRPKLEPESTMGFGSGSNSYRGQPKPEDSEAKTAMGNPPETLKSVRSEASSTWEEQMGFVQNFGRDNDGHYCWLQKYINRMILNSLEIQMRGKK